MAESKSTPGRKEEALPFQEDMLAKIVDADKRYRWQTGRFLPDVYGCVAVGDEVREYYQTQRECISNK